MKTFIRPLHLSDLPQIQAIEGATQVAPWAQESFLLCFESGYPSWVLELDGKIIGFIILVLQVDECHILNLAVATPYQHQGLGQQLLLQGIEYSRAEHAMVIYLEVRCSNTRAVRLYQKIGFQQIGERKDYYRVLQQHEDALVLAKYL